MNVDISNFLNIVSVINVTHVRV